MIKKYLFIGQLSFIFFSNKNISPSTIWTSFHTGLCNSLKPWKAYMSHPTRNVGLGVDLIKLLTATIYRFLPYPQTVDRAGKVC